ncbi:hypothetical protein GH714_005827 [Hevea brasiliensis]|uniref:SHSP domain-containing protein n=1 Tax=Hevea brasiliensis TaxID=3981 RepID=A0A6A6LEL6_HEVBR|nr:hypothetical protein GH714_005827 [Hevea brasiliensis]
MDSRQQRTAAAERVYEDFEPSMDWLREPGADTLRVYLPGFKREQMKVQVTPTRSLKISGERPLTDSNKWSRFRKEIPIDSNYDHNEIGAKFEKGLLFIRHPKIIVPANEPQEMIKPSMEPPKPPPTEAPKPPKPPQEKAQPPAEPPKLKKQPSNVQKPKKQTAPAETSKPETKIEPSKPEKPINTEPQAAGTPNIGMDKQSSGKADGVGNGNSVSQQMIEKEKVTSKHEQKDKSNGIADAGRDMTTTSTSTKQEKLADYVQDKTAKNGVGTGIVREVIMNLQQKFSSRCLVKWSWR